MKSETRKLVVPPILFYGEEGSLATKEFVPDEAIKLHYDPVTQTLPFEVVNKGATYDWRSSGSKEKRQDKVRVD